MTQSTKSKKSQIHLSENTRLVLEKRYLKKDPNGKVIESPGEMFRRVAGHIALAEKNYSGDADVKKMEKKFYRMMTEFLFLPNSPTLMNAGRTLGQLAACFVLPVEDSIEGIFAALTNAALIHKSGGGTGFSFSRIRPKNSKVGSTGGIASGPISFMKIFDTATEQVKQGGNRRGANMAILRVDHPDILEFINCKQNKKELNNFNISVAVTDLFMEAVFKETDYALINPVTGKRTGSLNAPLVYKELIQSAWETGDPGIVFLDEINRGNATPELGEIESTNPCGEQPLLPMEACNLGSINLAKFTKKIDGITCVDYGRLEETVCLAVRFLDNTIDMSRYPLPEINDMVHGNRKIGLGVMGFADLLFTLGIPYDSDDAVDLAEEIMGFIQKKSHGASMELARERGAFPNFEKSVYKDGPPIRNATTTTIAPTGTISIISGCSSGIEPVFALSFVRTVMDNDRLLEVNPIFAHTAEKEGFYSKELMKTVAEKGSIKGNTKIPLQFRKIFVTAHDILPETHIRMQAAFQRHTDNAVSKTVNLPGTARVEDVKTIYNLAHSLGCKGVTIYRDGCKAHQVLSISSKEDEPGADGFLRAVKKRPQTLEGFTTRVKTGMGHLYVTVTEFEGRPFEVFATIGKSGKSTMAKTEAIGRLVSLALRSGVDVEDIVDQIKGITGEHVVFQNGDMVLSIPDAIGQVLEKRYLLNRTGEKIKRQGNSLKGDLCPECGATIAFEEGCMTCHNCGYTKCG